MGPACADSRTAWAGRDYALTGYRIFVRHRDRTGRTRRGLHILRSDTDRRSMKLGGNLLTHYRYRLAGIDLAPFRRPARRPDHHPGR